MGHDSVSGTLTGVPVEDRLVQVEAATASEGPVYRTRASAQGFPTLKEVSTLYELFKRSAEQQAALPCLGWRPSPTADFTWLTYAEVANDVAQISAALKALGLARQQRVGVFGPNCPEWMIAMQACNRMSMECVPLYDSLGENAVEYIVTHSETNTAFVAASKFPVFVATIPKFSGIVKNAIYWGEANSEDIQAAKGAGLNVLSFQEAKELGAKSPVDPDPPKPDELCTIMYTSGTTGVPKGVMLTHAQVVAAVSALVHFTDQVGVKYKPGARLLSYLPLAHIFDRTAEEFILYNGGSIGYWQGDITKLVDDIGALKPHLFIGVPRVFDRIHSRIMGQLQTSSPVKKGIFKWALARKSHFMEKGHQYDKASPLTDKLVFNKIKQRLGGNVDLILSGGAPLAPHVEDFLKVAMCAPVVQGYGLTETCAASFVGIPGDTTVGNVGPPMPCTEFRLQSVPEMEYNALNEKSPSGEVLIRGPQTFNGYFKMQEQTEEVLDSNGWFHTGDIGTITETKTLKIIDRKKNIFKLSQGEYVAVEKLEAAYKKNSLVEQIFVYGNSFKASLVAVVVPAEAELKRKAKENSISSTNFEDLCTNEAVERLVLTELKATGKAERLKGFESISRLILESRQFSVEDELLTPTFKLRRPQLQKKYQKRIDEMYEAVEKQ